MTAMPDSPSISPFSVRIPRPLQPTMSGVPGQQAERGQLLLQGTGVIDRGVQQRQVGGFARQAFHGSPGCLLDGGAGVRPRRLSDSGLQHAFRVCNTAPQVNQVVRVDAPCGRCWSFRMCSLTYGASARLWSGPPEFAIKSGMRIVQIPLLKDNYGYLLVCEKTNQASIVDPSEGEPVWRTVQEEGVELVSILNTQPPPGSHRRERVPPPAEPGPEGVRRQGGRAPHPGHHASAHGGGRRRGRGRVAGTCCSFRAIPSGTSVSCSPECCSAGTPCSPAAAAGSSREPPRR